MAVVGKEESTFEPKPFGRYVLLDKLAVGGMAEIYKAKTYGVDGFEKLLAIKRILPHCAADKEFINMLVDEAKLTVLLSHANIVQVYDLGKVGDDYFISMEYINGTNLREVMSRLTGSGEKVPEEVSVYIISEICKGLDYAHRKTDSQGVPLNIVHRDISPQNILISYEGEVKIVDFGIAKAAMNVSHTMAGILKGKIAYMSPEQALGKPLDHRTDIFSTGLLFYEMMTGEKLFSGETQFEVLNKIRTTRINTLMLPEQLPGTLKAIVCKALAYNPKDRYQSVGDFQLDLTKYLYSSYIDFSPRMLATLVNRLFQKEIHRKEVVPTIDDKTRSVLIKQATAENIMVHGAMPREAGKGQVTTQKTAVSGVYSLPALKKLGRIGAAVGGLVVAAAAGYFGYQSFMKPERPKPPPLREERIVADLGSFQVITDPSGARILLNGAETGLVTPATLQRLPLGREYEIRLEKESYQEVVRKYALTTTDPIVINQALKPLSVGVINITSNPSGARINLDGRDTGLTTPNQVGNLDIPKNYQIRLSMPGHAEWSGTVEVRDPQPVKIAAALARLPDMPPPPPPPPLQQTQQQVASIQYGRLEIRSDPPQARVMLNGIDTGRLTPIILDRLESGKPVSITVSKEGYETWRRKGIAINTDETTPLMAALTKKEIAAKPVERPVREEPAREVSGEPATIRFDSNPSGADVFINDEFKGSTPIQATGIRPGRVKLLVSKSGYLKYASTVTLAPGENPSLGTIQLQDLYGELSLSSTPPRADIYFDGDLIAPKTPVTIRKVPRDRSHTVRLILEGYQTWEASFEMKDSPSKIYNVTLEKK